ncbi:MAG: HD domain-containing protein [Pseudomonadota bacterium]|nr:HD domain-containing protein [Pseudomonadota bacterium]
MNFRRSEFDVTNRINTTDPVCVKLEVTRIFKTLYSRNQAPILNRALDDVVRMYRGEFPGYARCDTEYHDVQHVLEVTLAMARLLDGYERTRDDGPHIDERNFQLGVICALYHDCGYIRKVSDTRHRSGAEYTSTHVTRGGRFLKEYLPQIGMEDFADVAGQILHFTGYERRVETIKLDDPMHRLLGSLLGSADIIAQMSDRCYLEKCRDRLYPEFVAGGITRKSTDTGEVVVFASAEDLLRKTPSFYSNAAKRLDGELGGAYQYAQAHFNGPNLYMDALKQNIRFAERAVASGSGEIVLRRQPPSAT